MSWNTEKCRIRRSGINLLVDIHVRVDPRISVFEGHEISHRVKDWLLAYDPRIQDVIIHLEPGSGLHQRRRLEIPLSEDPA